MFVSVFDVFKISVGPSSSHTMGPMSAAVRFIDEIRLGDWPRPAGAEVAGLSVSLHGSLAFTGVGHATDRAVILDTGEVVYDGSAQEVLDNEKLRHDYLAI